MWCCFFELLLWKFSTFHIRPLPSLNVSLLVHRHGFSLLLETQDWTWSTLTSFFVCTSYHLKTKKKKYIYNNFRKSKHIGLLKKKRNFLNIIFKLEKLYDAVQFSVLINVWKKNVKTYTYSRCRLIATAAIAQKCMYFEIAVWVWAPL